MIKNSKKNTCILLKEFLKPIKKFGTNVIQKLFLKNSPKNIKVDADKPHGYAVYSTSGNDCRKFEKR